METKNKKLTVKEENRKYYEKSDGEFMPAEKALFAHKFLDRFAWEREWIYKLESQSHIEVGCKDGYQCMTLATEGLDVIGIDPSGDAIDEAELRAKEFGLDIIFLKGYFEDIKDLPHCDTISCLEVLEHVLDVDTFMEKLTQSADYVLISTPDINGRHGMKDSERNEEHINLFSQGELEEIVKQYGDIIESVIRDDQICIIYKSR